MTTATTTAPASGEVAPGFESVRETFSQGLPLLGAGGGAVAITVDGRPVVDLWGGVAAPGQPWERDTTTVLMSCTKGLAGLCIQMLVDRGQLDLAAPVASYWPEFAQQGKEAITVRQIMTHTSGVLGFDGVEDLLGWDGRGWDDHDAVSAALAAGAPSWTPGTRHGYHAISFGWLVDELVRRTDGRTLGRFFADEVAAPLGLDVRIGTPAAAQASLASLVAPSYDGLPQILIDVYEATKVLARTDGMLLARAFLGGGGTSLYEQMMDIASSPRVLSCELPAFNATASARGLARVWGALACGGELDGVRLVSTGSVDDFSREVLVGVDETLEGLRAPGAEILLAATVARTEAYQANHPNLGGVLRFGPSPRAFGTEGFGGQLAFADPERRVSFAFVRSGLAVADALAPQLIDALYAQLDAS